jgi:hypothetical protein
MLSPYCPIAIQLALSVVAPVPDAEARAKVNPVVVTDRAVGQAFTVVVVLVVIITIGAKLYATGKVIASVLLTTPVEPTWINTSVADTSVLLVPPVSHDALPVVPPWRCRTIPYIIFAEFIASFCTEAVATVLEPKTPLDMDSP